MPSTYPLTQLLSETQIVLLHQPKNADRYERVKAFIDRIFPDKSLYSIDAFKYALSFMYHTPIFTYPYYIVNVDQISDRDIDVAEEYATPLILLAIRHCCDKYQTFSFKFEWHQERWKDITCMPDRLEHMGDDYYSQLSKVNGHLVHSVWQMGQDVSEAKCIGLVKLSPNGPYSEPTA